MNRFGAVLSLTCGLAAASTALCGGPALAEPAPPAPPVSTPPATPKPTPSITLSPDGQTIYLVGMLLDGAYFRFEDVLRKAPRARTVYLGSAGGLTVEGRMIAALVRKRGLDTYVGHYCASACTQIFASGRQRIIGPGAQLGFHEAVLVDDAGKAEFSRAPSAHPLTQTSVFGVSGNDTLRLGYQVAGIDKAFIDKALSYDHKAMWHPEPAELLSARVITRQAETSELAAAPGSGGNRQAVRERLMAGPLWQVFARSLPGETETAIDEVWRAANTGSSFDEAVLAGRSRLVTAFSRGLPAAPDPLLSVALTLYGSAGREQRSRGYPACKQDLTGPKALEDPQDIAFTASEDALMIAILNTPGHERAIPADEANRILAREIIPLVLPSMRSALRGGEEGKCRLGFAMFEAIDGMTGKKRLRAYRALLSLGASIE